MIIIGTILIVLQILSIIGVGEFSPVFTNVTSIGQFFYDLLFCLSYYFIGILGAVLLIVGIVGRMKKANSDKADTDQATDEETKEETNEGNSKREYIYAEAANGMEVRIPKDKYPEWKAAQDRIRAGEKPEHSHEIARRLRKKMEKAKRDKSELVTECETVTDSNKKTNTNLLIAIIILATLVIFLSVVVILLLTDNSAAGNDNISANDPPVEQVVESLHDIPQKYFYVSTNDGNYKITVDYNCVSDTGVGDYWISWVTVNGGKMIQSNGTTIINNDSESIEVHTTILEVDDDSDKVNDSKTTESIIRLIDGSYVKAEFWIRDNEGYHRMSNGYELSPSAEWEVTYSVTKESDTP